MCVCGVSHSSAWQPRKKTVFVTFLPRLWQQKGDRPEGFGLVQKQNAELFTTYSINALVLARVELRLQVADKNDLGYGAESDVPLAACRPFDAALC